MLKKITAIFLLLVLTLTCFGMLGCKDKKTEEIEDTGVGTLINGFEYFDRDVQLIRLFNEFGKVDQNSDKKFVLKGEKSLKITPLGDRMSNANPFFLVPTFSTRFTELNYGDFTKVDKVTCWLYNAEETPVTVGIGFGKGALKMDSRRDLMQKTNVEYFTLNSGWNYIEYTVLPELLTLQGLDLKEVYGIVFEFDYVESHDLKDSPEIYLDEVRLVYGEEKSTEFTKTFEKTETEDGRTFWMVSDFEDPTESYYYYYNYAFPAPAAGHPIVKTVFAGDYGVITDQGTQVLLIQKKNGGDAYGWPTLVLHPNVLKAVFKSIGEDLVNNPQNYAFCYDIYNGSNVKGGWGMEFYPDYKDGNKEQVKGLGTSTSISVEVKSWLYYSKNIGTLNDIEKTVQANYDSVDIKPFTEEPYVNIRWSNFAKELDTSDRPFFIDNVRIEKIA